MNRYEEMMEKFDKEKVRVLQVETSGVQTVDSGEKTTSLLQKIDEVKQTYMANQSIGGIYENDGEELSSSMYEAIAQEKQRIDKMFQSQEGLTADTEQCFVDFKNKLNELEGMYKENSRFIESDEQEFEI